MRLICRIGRVEKPQVCVIEEWFVMLKTSKGESCGLERVMREFGRLQIERHCSYIYIYIYMSWFQVTPSVTICNVTLPNYFLQNSYFENLIVEFHVLYVLNIHTNFHVNWLLFTIQSINSFIIHYFKLKNFEFK